MSVDGLDLRQRAGDIHPSNFAQQSRHVNVRLAVGYAATGSGTGMPPRLFAPDLLNEGAQTPTPMNSNRIDETTSSRYMPFTRDEWARLRESTPLTLSESDLERLRGLNEPVSVQEVVDIYLPLSRLLNLHVAATQELHAATGKFLGDDRPGSPYIIGVAGSVAVGKSTTSRLLRALLARWPDHPRVDLVTTDGFLLPERRAPGARPDAAQGLPGELRPAPPRAVRGGHQERRARKCGRPVYSHTRLRHRRGRVAGRDAAGHPDPRGAQRPAVGQPAAAGPQRLFVSDFFDFSIYVDADERRHRAAGTSSGS